MKKGICYGCLPAELSMEERFRLAAAAGLHGIEIGALATRDEYVACKAIAEATGVAVPSIMLGTHWSHPLTAADPDVRRHTIDHTLAAIEHAPLVGADTLLLVPGQVNAETTYEQAYARALESVKTLAPSAEKAGITIAIENVWNRFLLSPIEFKRFIEEVGSPAVRAYFDCGNILAYGFPQHWIRTLGPLLHRVHVKDFRYSDRSFVYLLQGDVPWAEVMQALREVGYDSYITAEMPPYPQCPDQMVHDTSTALDRIFTM